MKIAFCGLRHGHIFSLYRLARDNPQTRVVGAWEENPAAREAAVQTITEPFFDHYEQILSNPDVDIVAVGDYYGIRGERVIRALRAGKHVLCDKPVCTHLSELDEIERLCREKGLFVGCMLDLRYDPALRLTRQLVREGRLGEIHAINFTGQHPLSYGVRPGWYFEEGKHGGTFNDIAIHGMDAVRMVTGLTYQKTLCARQYNAFAAQERQFADCAQLLGQYENGAGLVADVSYSAPACAFSLPSYWRFSFWGDKGMIECRLGSGEVLFAPAGAQQPERLSAPAVDEDCLRDLIGHIRGEKTAFEPNDALISTRVTLNIQAFADQTREG